MKCPYCFPNTLKSFPEEAKTYGVKIAIGNQLIHFTKWFVGAKAITLSYK